MCSVHQLRLKAPFVLVAGMLFCLSVAVSGQVVRQHFEQREFESKPLIRSPAHPTDSLGESVYEVQGEDQKQYAVVPGALVPPIPLKLPKPKFTASLKAPHATQEVPVEGVITEAGRFIDLQVTAPVDPDVRSAALEAVSRYRYKAATLDGRPIAVFVRIVIHFEWR